MARAEQLNYTSIPPDLTSEVIGLCDELYDDFGRIMVDSQHYSGGVSGETAGIRGRASSGAFWRALRVGDAVLNLDLFHWGSFEPPRTLEVLLRQQGSWPCSVSIEHPAASLRGLSVRSELSRFPGVGCYEIRPKPEGPGLKLHAYSGTARALLKATGVKNVTGLWDALEQAIQNNNPTGLSTHGSYALSTSQRGVSRTSSIRGEEHRTQMGIAGEWDVEREIEIAFSGMLRFFAARTSGPSLNGTLLRVQYETADEVPNGASARTLRERFEPGDKALVEKVGRSLLERYRRYLLVA